MAALKKRYYPKIDEEVYSAILDMFIIETLTYFSMNNF